MEINKKLRLKEELNKKYFLENPLDTIEYPHLDDTQLQKKISLKKEFLYKYDGELKDVTSYSNIICKKNEKFELAPHQEFIKRFISYNTPYNGVLLFHGLGSGKTCSAIGITEAYREYSKYISNFKKIIIIASPNVQENFKLQLFDSSKLKNINNNWQINGCLGNSLLDELNTYQINTLTKEEVIQKIQKLISNYYDFTGYIEFSNRIQKCIVIKEGGINHVLTKKKLKSEFQNSLIVIDEVHNIRINSDIKNDKKVAKSLYQLVNYVKYLKLIFLTGTPMYNDPKEILFILNILNMNDERSQIGTREIFDSNDNFVVKDGIEIGKELFISKANGYISYVRGENPYSFPYLIMPHKYKSPNSLKIINSYPSKQFNNKTIKEPIKYLDLFISPLSETQEEGYLFFLDKVLEKYKEQDTFEDMDSFKYSIVQPPINALNIIYPVDSTFLTGNNGLDNIMKYVEKINPPTKNNFEYKRLHNMFSYNEIGQYSHKIKTILDHIINSEGIVLIYSGYIDGGIVPMALALEHIGFTRYGATNKTLFKNKPYLTEDEAIMKGFKYSIISGEKTLSPNNNEEIEALTNNNDDGQKVKVVLISQAGSEGIDLKNIRQVHIMDPWYNMNRIEQIIGRARRNCSHMNLPLEKRNVQVFLHASQIVDSNNETMDMYLYRLSEKKSIKIGNITKVIKSVSVDCLLNKEQQSFSKMNQSIQLTLSSDKKTSIKFNVNDEPFTSLCDYSDTCNYECINTIGTEDKEDISSYSYQFTKNNKIKDKIKSLFKIKHVYTKKQIFSLIKNKNIHNEEIIRALQDLEKESLIDMFGRKGHIVNSTNLYFFHPFEISDLHSSLYEKMTPIEYKQKTYVVDTQIDNNERVEVESDLMNYIYDKYTKGMTEIDDLKSEDDWYSFYYKGAQYLKKLNVSDEELKTYLIAHICEQLNYEDEIQLINEINKKNDEIEILIKNYYKQFIIEKNGIIGLILFDFKSKDTIEHIFVYDINVWREANYTERNIIMPEYVVSKYRKPLKPQYKIVGFMGLNNATNTYEFKVKFSDDTKSKGAVIENKSKSQIIALLNETINKSDAFNTSNTKLRKKNELCVIEELLLRHYDTISFKKSRTFFNKLEYYYLNKN
jgi:superfamily II DNA or RNA helicase